MEVKPVEIMSHVGRIGLKATAVHRSLDPISLLPRVAPVSAKPQFLES